MLVSLLSTFALLMAIGAASKTTEDYSRVWFFAWVGTSVVLLPALRMLAIAWVQKALRRGHIVYKALCVGIGCTPLDAAAIHASSNGLVTVNGTLRLRRISELQALGARIGRDGYDKVYIRAPWALTPQISQAMAGLKRLSADVYLVPDLAGDAPRLVAVHRLAGHVSLQISDRPIDGWNYWLKRVQDVAIAAMALCLLAPVLVLIVVAIKLESPGPVLFRQRRFGFNGQPFELYKFRSMYASQCDADGVRQTGKSDARVTRVGRLLRRTSLDEVPQLLNVLQGSMSIVGPRPHALHTTTEGRTLVEAVDDYASRHRVKPGMTGWAQIHGCRGELNSIDKLQQRVEYDLEYIRSWSMLLDVRIILSTLGSLLMDPNAY